MLQLKRLIVLTIIVAVIAAIYVFVFSTDKSFPELPVGSFSGRIILKDPLTDSNNLDFYVHNDIAGMNGGFHPVINFSDRNWRASIQANTYKIETPSGELIFTGSEERKGYYAGRLEDKQGVEVASWTLQQINRLSNLESVQEVQSINQLLIMSSDLQEIESRIRTKQITIEQQKGEIERLSEYLNEGKSLKNNADKKYQEKKAELEVLKSKKESKLKEAQELREKFEISQRLFGVGKLVHLSRSVQDYEKRWFNSMYTSTGVDTDGDFENLVERAQRIITLKKEISYELNNFE